MTAPKAYDPQDGYKYHILTRNPEYDREWEHCDYAADAAERDYLITNYRQAYGAGWQFQSIRQPRRYWPARRLPTPKHLQAAAAEGITE